MRTMRRRSIKSRKGIGTAIGTAFFIIIVLISIATFWTISSYEITAQNVRQQMTQRDTDRISEDLFIRGVNSIIILPPPQRYNFSLIVDNTGGVLVNIARIYILNQTGYNANSTLEPLARVRSLKIYNPLNKSAPTPQRFTGFNNSDSAINTGEVSHVIRLNGTMLNSAYQYRIILTTDRGRQFSYTYPPPSGYGSGGGGYSLVIDDSHNNFQYAAGADPTFKSAYVLPKSKNNIVYRVLIKNTTTKNIVLMNNCSMNDASYSGGHWLQRYNVGNTSTPANHVAFPSQGQTINANSSQYVYFAADVPGSTTWLDDQTTQGVYYVGFILAFRYQGETELRHFGLPSLTKELT